MLKFKKPYKKNYNNFVIILAWFDFHINLKPC